MPLITLILICWAVCTGLFVLLLIYRGQLTRHEVDVVHLSETDGHDESEHDAIVSQVDKLTPVVRVLGVLTGVCTVALVGTYLRDLLAHSHF